MHIGMRLLHPTAAGHSVIITRQQVQLFTSEPYHSAPDIYYECLLESTLSGKLLSWWYSASVVVVLPCWVDCTHQAALNPVCAASAHLPCELQHIKRAKSERAFTGVTSCISECGCYLAPGDGHDRCLSCLGIKVAFVDESCSHCGKISIEELRTRLCFLQRGRVPVPLPWSRAPPGSSWGSATSGSSWAGLTVMVRNSLWSCWRNRLDIHMVPLVSFGARRSMSIAASEGEPDLSGDDDSAPLPHSRRPAMPDSGTEMVAMLAWAAEKVTRGNIYRIPNPRGWTIDFSRWLALVLRAPPWYLSFRKCMMRSLGRGRHLSLPETAPVARPSSPPSTVGQRGGIWRSHRWNGMLRCNCVQIPQPPGVGIRRSPALTSSAYAAWGEATSPLHAMALLQVHQDKALRDLHEGGHDPEVLKELRTATDLALRAMKVTARSLGLAMSTMVHRRQRLYSLPRVAPCHHPRAANAAASS